MEIKLTNQETENFFYSALCNGGLMYLGQYGIELDYSDKHYNKARKQLKNPCFEDVLVQILKDGNTLTFTDNECGQDTVHLTLADVHTKMKNVPVKHLTDLIEENDDADTGDVVLQTLLYNDIIFG